MDRGQKLKAVYALAALVSLLAFTPLVIPSGVTEPWLLGMPRTLWTGILITIALVFLTFLAARYSPPEAEDPEDLPEIDRRMRPS